MYISIIWKFNKLLYNTIDCISENDLFNFYNIFGFDIYIDNMKKYIKLNTKILNKLNR